MALPTPKFYTRHAAGTRACPTPCTPPPICPPPPHLPSHHGRGRYESLPYPSITRAYVIHSYWDKVRDHMAGDVCRRLEALGIECHVWPGLYLKPLNATQLAAVVAANPVSSVVERKSWLEWLGWLLGGSNQDDMLVYNPPAQVHAGSLGNSLSHIHILRNWTSGTLLPSNLPAHSQVGPGGQGGGLRGAPLV